MWNVRIKTLHTGCDINLQQKHRKTLNENVLTGQSEAFGYSLSYKLGTKQEQEQHLIWTQLIGNTLPYVLPSFYIICVSFVKDRLVLRDTHNEHVSHCCWCCRGRHDIRSIQPLWLDDAFDCSAKVRKNVPRSQKLKDCFYTAWYSHWIWK